MPTPIEIRLHQAKRKLEVSFDDGKQFILPCEYLRVYSPSAEVRGHGAGQEKLVLNKAEVMVDAIEPVGNYAVKLVFSDGHQSGLYTWDYLYDLGHEREQKWQAYLARVAAKEEGA